MFLIRTVLLTFAMMFVVLSRENFHKSEDKKTSSYMWTAGTLILISQVI